MGWGDAVRLRRPRPTSSASTPRFRRSRRPRAGLRHRRARSTSATPATTAMAPVQWPVGRPARLFGAGGFFTPDRRGRMVPVTQPERGRADPAGRARAQHRPGARPLAHHDAHRRRRPASASTSPSPSSRSTPRTPAPAASAPPTWWRWPAPTAAILVRALVSDRVAPGSVFVPMHWNDQWASAARVDSLVTAATDPHSGQPALKMARGAGPPLRRRLARLRRQPRPARGRRPPIGRWRGPPPAGGPSSPTPRRPRTGRPSRATLFDAPEAEIVSIRDAARGLTRLALIAGRTASSPRSSSPPSRSTVARAHVVAALAEASPADLLAGRPGRAQADAGAIVCACFDVGVNTILAAITSGRRRQRRGDRPRPARRHQLRLLPPRAARAASPAPSPDRRG